MRFNDYLDEKLFLESLNEDDNVSKSFLTKLSSYIGGLRKLPGMVYNSIKSAFTTPPAQKIDRERLLKQVDDQWLQTAMSKVRMPKDVNHGMFKHYMDIFNKSLARHLTDGIAEDIYYKQLTNFIENPTTVSIDDILVQSKQDQYNKVVKAMNQVEPYVDPHAAEAIKKALSEVVPEAVLKQISFYHMGKDKEKIDTALSGYGFTHKDLRKEKKDNPEFKNRMRQIQAQRRKQFGKLPAPAESPQAPTTGISSID